MGERRAGAQPGNGGLSQASRLTARALTTFTLPSEICPLPVRRGGRPHSHSILHPPWKIGAIFTRPNRSMDRTPRWFATDCPTPAPRRLRSRPRTTASDYKNVVPKAAIASSRAADFRRFRRLKLDQDLLDGGSCSPWHRAWLCGKLPPPHVGPRGRGGCIVALAAVTVGSSFALSRAVSRRARS